MQIFCKASENMSINNSRLSNASKGLSINAITFGYSIDLTPLITSTLILLPIKSDIIDLQPLIGSHVLTNTYSQLYELATAEKNH